LRFHLTRPLAILGLAWLIAGAPGASAAEPVTIAVVKDGPSTEERILDPLLRELDHRLGERWTPRYKQSPAFDAGWDPGRCAGAVQAALDDPEVDMVLGLGYLVIQAAADEALPLNKPFLGFSPVLGDAPPLPYSPDDFSTKPNFLMGILPRGAAGVLRAFKDVAALQSVHVLLDAIELQHLENLSGELEQVAAGLAIPVTPVAVAGDADAALAAVPGEAQGVLLTRLPRLSLSERRRLVDGLVARGLPSFSTEGSADLELGVLATNLPDLERQAIRRTAGNIRQLLRGEDSASLPVFLLPNTRLQVNGRSAAAIGFKPSYATRLAIDVLHAEALEADLPALTLAKVYELAESGNFNLAISQTRVEEDLRSKQISRGGMFPELIGDGSFVTHDYQGLAGLFPDEMGFLGLQLRQMIYDDRTISDFRSSGRLYEASTYRNEVERLDLLAQSGHEYLNYVLSRLFYGIELQNLRLTEANLGIARTRLEVGQAGRDEVFRWEAELANRQGRLLASEAVVEEARITLNQTLALDQSIAWRPVEIAVDTTGAIPGFDGRFDHVFASRASYEAFRDAVVTYSLRHAPEGGFYDKQVEAQRIQLGQRKRSFFLPSIGAQVNREFNVYTSDEEGLKREGTVFSIEARLPLFDRTQRLYDVKRQGAMARKVEYELALADDLVERRARTVLAQLESSYPNVKFNRRAANRARRNLEVVREKYANGIVTITDLLNAQNAAFNADIRSASADYVFLKDLVDLQRALSFFIDEHSAEERQAFFDEMQAIEDEQRSLAKESSDEDQ
jgi:outer membrane protein TolC